MGDDGDAPEEGTGKGKKEWVRTVSTNLNFIAGFNAFPGKRPGGLNPSMILDAVQVPCSVSCECCIVLPPLSWDLVIAIFLWHVWLPRPHKVVIFLTRSNPSDAMQIEHGMDWSSLGEAHTFLEAAVGRQLAAEASFSV